MAAQRIWVTGGRGFVGSHLTRELRERGHEVIPIDRGPEASDDPVQKDEPFAVVESVKAVSDVYAPLTGRVTEVNDELPNSPEVINQDPYGDGWMVRMQLENKDELDELLSAAEYEELVNELA